MIALLQRVSGAGVRVGGDEIARIERGLLVLLGVEKTDDDSLVDRMVERITGYRVFEDDQGKMNLGLRDVQGQLLLVPQFTLAADTRKGMRPSFSSAAVPDEGRRLFDAVVQSCRRQLPAVETGEFGADMQVELVNDGPVTFWLQVN